MPDDALNPNNAGEAPQTPPPEATAPDAESGPIGDDLAAKFQQAEARLKQLQEQQEQRDIQHRTELQQATAAYASALADPNYRKSMLARDDVRKLVDSMGMQVQEESPAPRAQRAAPDSFDDGLESTPTPADPRVSQIDRKLDMLLRRMESQDAQMRRSGLLAAQTDVPESVRGPLVDMAEGLYRAGRVATPEDGVRLLRHLSKSIADHEKVLSIQDAQKTAAASAGLPTPIPRGAASAPPPAPKPQIGTYASRQATGMAIERAREKIEAELIRKAQEG